MRTVQAKDTRPLALQVYDRICAAIVDGSMPAGSALVQEQIASQFGVSRTPVRDALTQVALEGLATLVPGRGYIVNELTESDVNSVYEVREKLEALAASQAFGHHTPLEMVRLRGLIDEFEAVDPHDGEELFRLGTGFHGTLIAPCPNGYLRGLLADIWNHPLQRRISNAHFVGPDNQKLIADDHRRILAALSEGDVDAMVEALRCCNDPQLRQSAMHSESRVS
ncbi:DNA-binding GntR family transcriptional regulator [Arthrobacter ginsengisoli]|uniref:DNA-binding GntR family transcriptional regulator n=1 Tax=Arthrobacter ginsengisoli TaxID=1356565 RepID=A0ABU1UE38_9MICC|nr:GntR family transcriptional regulator [Arthrobacter ginsengisoli]MDR7083396.1 DNA-binding GntR family transcriptional regulator [Arthrobacter ginsengisoli]